MEREIMASAGRVLIIPRGKYDPAEEYEMLDLVRDKFATYICKKTAVGIQPSTDTTEDYWMKLTEESADEQDVQDAFDYVFGTPTV